MTSYSKHCLCVSNNDMQNYNLRPIDTWRNSVFESRTCRRMCGLTSRVLQPSNRPISIFQNSCLGKCCCVYSSQSYSWVVKCSSITGIRGLRFIGLHLALAVQISIDQLHARSFRSSNLSKRLRCSGS